MWFVLDFIVCLCVLSFGMYGMSKQYILLYTLRVLHSKVDLYSTTMVCPLVWMAVVHPWWLLLHPAAKPVPNHCRLFAEYSQLSNHQSSASSAWPPRWSARLTNSRDDYITIDIEPRALQSSNNWMVVVVKQWQWRFQFQLPRRCGDDDRTTWTPCSLVTTPTIVVATTTTTISRVSQVSVSDPRVHVNGDLEPRRCAVVHHWNKKSKAILLKEANRQQQHHSNHTPNGNCLSKTNYFSSGSLLEHQLYKPPSAHPTASIFEQQFHQ